MSNFSVDALLANLKTLQNEKNCLEQKLNKCREKRRLMESEVEKVTGKYIQVGDVHRKMIENLKVAQLKVTQTQSKTDSLEEANQKKRDKIAALNKTIENEKENQQNHVHKFEDHLQELTDKLIKARTYYKEENLKEELVSKKEKIEVLSKTLCEKHNEEESLVTAFNLARHEDTEPKEPFLPLEVCQGVWRMIEDENKAIHSYLDQLQTDLKGIHESPAQTH